MKIPMITSLSCARYARSSTPSRSLGRGSFVGGMSLGDFRVTRYASDESVTGEDMATKAAMKELAGTGMAFAGVR